MRIVVLLDPETDFASLESRTGKWTQWFDAYVIDALRELGHETHLVHFGPHLDETVASLRRIAPDLVFNLALHALDDRGKDAYPAAVLELLGLPYTGSGPRGLLLAGDKALSKLILRANGIDVPRFCVVTSPREAADVDIGYPIIVKALSRGGSEGLRPASRVTNRAALRGAIKHVISDWDRGAICEEYVDGRELSVGVLGTGNIRVLSPGEWRFGRGPQFVTERLKWDKAYCKRCGTTYGPAKLTATTRRRVVEICRETFRLLELRDYGSIDLRVTADGRIVVLEANANPGLWPGSGRWKTVPFPRLIGAILRGAVNRARTAEQ